MTSRREWRQWHGTISDELRHVVESVAQIRGEIQELRLYVIEQFEEHRKYHKANEARWGPARWCEQHPWRMAAAAAGAGVLFTIASGNQAANLAAKVFTLWLGH